MQGFKFTCWNIEHADKLLDDLGRGDAAERRRAEARRDAIREEIAALDADILLVCEGPNGEARANRFFALVAPDHDLVVRGSGDRRDYGMQGTDASTGRQWIWFLIRKGRPITGELLHLDQWRSLTEANSAGEHRGGSWDVSYPKFVGGQLQFDIDRNHSHWRHPQVLLARVDGVLVEIIGAHLKSKLTQVRATGEPSDAAFFANNPALVADLIKARTKITTECSDIRHYIDARFKADASAPIIVAGDLNDGPGKERIERRFLYHDLISSLQGEIFFARRFLNHALFDAPEDERWSVFFRDRLDPGRDPRILLDHVLFSQAFTNNPQVEPFAFAARRRGGLVEHEVHHAVTGTRPKYALTSDHKPVSMSFDRRSAPVA
ncbi:endonuclease/exonuclease/phosphatase [Polymorphum gilvum]|uniref:Endonuclease/exonuclease/phosphatase family protein n=1 Tax=Polymorphum gilvum (strain LMG 25793 / CGMCC 1.9160 / SL003B-26A1) TaxID=991905 RepID=F2J1G3_POLGS|nr:endonuclease/exonuclease/phosphatase [Polymorphum gilvum]ADZ69745.1 Endonuclease/exonuclease/phosphatase family protein [Polymorphum gilvum SL003B-26A1]